MKKVLVLVSAVFMLAVVSTSCNKTGCHCYVKTDIMHIAPEYEDETSTKEECKAIEQRLNEEEGINIYKCKQ
jgi:ABC-type phosphate/phosphonate transport system substrate-binding protein